MGKKNRQRKSKRGGRGTEGREGGGVEEEEGVNLRR